MISARGPDRKILVVDRVGVTVLEVCMAVIEKRSLLDVQARFPVTLEEIVECTKAYRAEFGPDPSDFLDIICHHRENETVLVETGGVSAWVYISVLSYAASKYPDETNTNMLYARGIEHIMFEQLSRLKETGEVLRDQGLYEIVYNSFRKSYCNLYGDLDHEDIDVLLASLEEEINGEYNDD